MASGVPSAVIMAKLGDKEFLRNYCEFAGAHRARIAELLFSNLDDEPNRRRSIALELTANYVSAIEDLVLWFFVLKRWRNNEGTLFDLLNSTSVVERPGNKYSTETALGELRAWTIADLRRELGLPTDDYLLQAGLNERALTNHLNAIRDLLARFREGLELRLEYEHLLVTAYNKVKHGVLAVATTETSRSGISVMIPSRPVSGQRKPVNVGWLPCDDEELSKLYVSTLLVSESTFTLLNLIYIGDFDAGWTLPEWPVPLPGQVGAT